MAREIFHRSLAERRLKMRHHSRPPAERAEEEAVLARFCRPLEELLRDEERLQKIVDKANRRRAEGLARARGKFDPGPPSGLPGQGKGWRGSWLSPPTGRGVAVMAMAQGDVA